MGNHSHDKNLLVKNNSQDIFWSVEDKIILKDLMLKLENEEKHSIKNNLISPQIEILIKKLHDLFSTK